MGNHLFGSTKSWILVLVYPRILFLARYVNLQLSLYCHTSKTKTGELDNSMGVAKSCSDSSPLRSEGVNLPASGEQKTALSFQLPLGIASDEDSFLPKGCTPFLELPISNNWLIHGSIKVWLSCSSLGQI